MPHTGWVTVRLNAYVSLSPGTYSVVVGAYMEHTNIKIHTTSNCAAAHANVGPTSLIGNVQCQLEHFESTKDVYVSGPEGSANMIGLRIGSGPPNSAAEVIDTSNWFRCGM
jgi:hypothetical protein